MGLGECIDLIEEPEEGTIDGIGGDHRVARSEVVAEHPRARLESVREVPEGDLAALTSHE